MILGGAGGLILGSVAYGFVTGWRLPLSVLLIILGLLCVLSGMVLPDPEVRE